MRVLLGLLVLLATAGLAAEPEETSCIACHGDADFFEGDELAIVEHFADDVHSQAGLSCHSCHGGNPDLETAEDFELSMSEDWEEDPYRGAPAAGEVPGFCGRCHSDPVYMKRFRPDARVDQEQEYWTSQHGIGLAAGDAAVATCTSCHGVHGIVSAEDSRSPVYPTRVAETCRTCHEDAERMAGYELADGRPLPVDQYARWQRSVHARALLDREDLSAPTCNDCHGNHGAAPPGFDSVGFVCGQCHGREAKLFRASSKHGGFEDHSEYVVDAGEEGCAACHEPPVSETTDVSSFAECTVCHGNHAVIRPTIALFSDLPDVPCAFCHEPAEGMEVEVLEPEKSRESYEATLDRLVGEGSGMGLEADRLFDWLVGQAEILPEHSLAGEERQQRPEFARLFQKFRLGKTHFTYADPGSGEQVEAQVRRCDRCHGSARDGEATGGAIVGAAMVERMRELTALTARAERILLAARRGGVETREALFEIDQAVDAQIGLEVLVHTFSNEEGGGFDERYREGMEHARAALAKGQESLDELAFRRRGLVVALAVILLALVALGLKIRQVSAQERRQSG